jgi:hypothetical protein
MNEPFDGISISFTKLFTAGLILLSFIVAGAVSAIARRWLPWPTAIGIGVLAGAWTGFISAGQILRDFGPLKEQPSALLIFGLVTCAARALVPWEWARRIGFWATAAYMAVQAVLMAVDLWDLAAGRLTRPGQETPLFQPRTFEWWVLGAPVPLLLTGLVLWSLHLLIRKLGLPRPAGGEPVVRR